jgi:hypothetical protein
MARFRELREYQALDVGTKKERESTQRGLAADESENSLEEERSKCPSALDDVQ